MLYGSKTLFALAATFALSAASANAADVYSTAGYKDAPVYAPVWTGFYLGINGGYGWGANDRDLTATTQYQYFTRNRGDQPDIEAGTDVESFSKLSADGGFGGGQFGYNLQRGNLVYGFEFDAQGADITGKIANTVTTGIGAVNVNASTELDWFATVRGRVGYAFDRGLIYFTGGVAAGGVKDTFAASTSAFPGGELGGTSFQAAYNETRAGYVLGGGIEYLLAPAWSLKIEYQYLDLGSDKVTGSIANAYQVGNREIAGYSATISTSKIDHTYDTVRAGLNYHLGAVYETLPLK